MAALAVLLLAVFVLHALLIAEHVLAYFVSLGEKWKRGDFHRDVVKLRREQF